MGNLTFPGRHFGVDFNPGCTCHLEWEPYCCFRDHDKLNCIESHFERELYHLQLVNELQCLESQLRQLCAVNCRTYILLVLESLLRLKLYARMRWPDYKQSQMISYQEGNSEQKVSSDESKSEDSSDYDTDESCFDMDCGHYESESEENSDCQDGSKSNTESESETESKLDDKPWRGDPTLCRLDSTLSKSATGDTEGTGPFFWIPTYDVVRHCAKYRCGVGCNSLRTGIRQFRLNKTWKYWLCYSCDESFIDRESHMVHLEDKHQLCLAHDDYWLIPKQDCHDEVEDLRQDEVKSEPGLEDSITLHHKYRRFLVDSTKLDQISSANEEGELGQAKRKEYMEIVDGLHYELCDLRHLFHTKRKYLRYLEVVNSLSLMLFNGGQPLALIVCWLRKLSVMDRCTGTTHQLQFRFLSQLLSQAHDQGYVALSNHSVQNAFQNMREDLISKIDWQDKKILEALVRIDNMKRNLSDICVCDYRTEIVPSVRSFLHAKFKFDDSLRSLGCNNVKELLSTLNQHYIHNPRFFSARVLSPGKVVIITRRKKPCWGLAIIGISLDFVGEWTPLGRMLKITGIFNYGALFTWPPGMCRSSGRVINCYCEPRPSMESVGVDVDNCLCEAVGDKLNYLTDDYFEQNR